MRSLIVSALFGVCVLAAQEATTAAPEETGGQYSYGAPEQAPPVYDQPQQQYYQPPPPFFGPIYAPPQYDFNYCSVHASFPLVGGHRHHKDHRHKRSYGVPQQDAASPAYAPVQQPQPVYAPPVYQQMSAYPQYPAYDNYYRRPRTYERKSCRYSATFDQETCQTCCRLASRSANTQAHEIFGAIFVFDPSTHGEGGKERVAQCVCCAPKKY